MNEQDAPPTNNTPPRIPADPSGRSQPLPPGAGSPVQPGPPLSVQAPIKDTTINLTALLVGAGIVILVVIVLIVLIAALTHR